MSSYATFFRAPDPPQNTEAFRVLHRTRCQRNLLRRLQDAQAHGNWIEALLAISRMQRGNPDFRVRAWHYALVVATAMRSTMNPLMKRTFLDVVDEESNYKCIPKGRALTSSLVAGFLACEDPQGAERVLRVGKENGIQLTAEEQSTAGLQIGFQYALRGKWEKALSLALDPILRSHPLALAPTLLLAHAYAGHWVNALQYRKMWLDVRGEDRKGEEERLGGEKFAGEHKETTDRSLARALALHGVWDAALRLLFTPFKTRGRTPTSDIFLLCSRVLGSRGKWEVLLRLTHELERHRSSRKSAYETSPEPSFDLTPREAEVHNGSILVALYQHSMWKEVLQFYLSSCVDLPSKDPLIRHVLFQAWNSAGYPEKGRQLTEGRGGGGVQEGKKEKVKVREEGENRSISTPAAFSALQEMDLLSDVDVDYITQTKEVGLGENSVMFQHIRRFRQPFRPASKPDLPSTVRDTYVTRLEGLEEHRLTENHFWDDFRHSSHEDKEPRPPPTGWHNLASGWTYWGQNGAPVPNHRMTKRASNFSTHFKLFRLDNRFRSWEYCSPRSMGHIHLKRRY